MSDWNTQVIEEFRANGGKVAQFGDAPLVILGTIGARSGQLREIPLVALVESDGDNDGMYIFASKGGAPSNPDWYHNLKANPGVEVEVAGDAYSARAEITEGDDRKALYDAQAARYAQFAEYETSAAEAGRTIPVIRLHRA